MFIIIAALEPDFFFDAYVYSSVLLRLVFSTNSSLNDISISEKH